MKGRRRITSIILALALALGLIPSVSSIAFADDTTEKVEDVYIDNTEEEESNVELTIHWSSVDGLDLMEPIIIKVSPKEDGTYPTLGEVLADNEIEWDGIFKNDGYTQMLLGEPIPPSTKPLTEYKAVVDVFYEEILDSTVIDTSMDIYKILLKEVDRLELTIEPPVCGESMGEFTEDEGISANPPVVTTSDEYNEVLNSIYTYWLILEEDYNADDSMFVGEKDYMFSILLGLKQGYVFVEDLDIVLDGGTIDDPTYFANIFLTVATMTPEHDPDTPIIEDIVSPTCEKDGSHTEIILCKACGEEISRETVVDEKLGHNWGAWTVTKEATETETGERRRICRIDPSHVEYETIPVVQKPVEFTLTYDLAGGEFDGSTDPIIETYEKDSVITIHDAPTKEGSTFLYWEGSKYMPGDKYTVTEDHTFTAVWEDAPTDEPGSDEPGTDNPGGNAGTEPGEGNSNSTEPSDSGNVSDDSSNSSTSKDDSSNSGVTGDSTSNKSNQGKPASNASGVPKTGDESFAVMWLVIALLSMIATFWLNRLYKKIMSV